MCLVQPWNATISYCYGPYYWCCTFPRSRDEETKGFSLGILWKFRWCQIRQVECRAWCSGGCIKLPMEAIEPSNFYFVLYLADSRVSFWEMGLKRYRLLALSWCTWIADPTDPSLKELGVPGETFTGPDCHTTTERPNLEALDCSPSSMFSLKLYNFLSPRQRMSVDACSDG